MKGLHIRGLPPTRTLFADRGDLVKKFYLTAPKIFVNYRIPIGVSPSGKAPDSDSAILGSNPSTPAIPKPPGPAISAEPVFFMVKGRKTLLRVDAKKPLRAEQRHSEPQQQAKL